MLTWLIATGAIAVSPPSVACDGLAYAGSLVDVGAALADVAEVQWAHPRRAARRAVFLCLPTGLVSRGGLRGAFVSAVSMHRLCAVVDGVAADGCGPPDVWIRTVNPESQAPTVPSGGFGRRGRWVWLALPAGSWSPPGG